MRFFSDGPNIPDLLLERRDQGRVVFLCGAGISLNAGMPTFVGLAKHVLDFFDPPNESQITTSFRPWKEGFEGPKIPLDQIFYLLYQEYGRDDVNALVAERLWMEDSGKAKSREHDLIARISADQEGYPQIVTTNFDRLFDQAMEGKSGVAYEPPAFPDISLGVSLRGITYLHGRLQEPNDKHHPYVLSSADFGRAYLSEAWATNFIRSLLDRYTVVLVGYQAEDPPVKYLLQGLNHDGMSDRSKLYAFDRGLADEIEAKWRDRGVTAIAYNDHPDLWQSFEAWALRADDPRIWRSQIVSLARNGPRQVAPHERGQVAHLVRTTAGARLFANADPSPPAEWLCVFDSSCRAAEPSGGYGEASDAFDPLEAYGLDDDPPRPLETGLPTHRVHDDLLEWRRGDANPPTFHRLGGRQFDGFEDMPPRLLHLSNWIAKHLESPAAAWWALRQNGLHARLMHGLRRQLRQKTDLHPEARRNWNLILEFQSDKRKFAWGGGWFELKDRFKSEGWNRSVLRDLELITAPALSRSRPLGVGASKPPFGNWENTSPQELGRWEVEFPDRHVEKVEIPDEVLEPVFRIAEGHLRRATGLMADIRPTYFRTPTCYPQREIDGDDREGNGDIIFSWFLDLFVRMVQHNPAIARAHAMNWPIEDEFYFRKLKLFSLNHAELFEADEAAEFVLALDQQAFWDVETARELLFFIHDKWENFSELSRATLIDRLLDGPDKTDECTEEEYLAIRDEFAARYTRWLTLRGRKLTANHTKRLEDIISGLPEWEDSWANSIVTEHRPRTGWVSTDETPDAVINLPVSKVVDRAKADLPRNVPSFVEKRPFTGLVKANPRKALASLSYAGKSGDYPQRFWKALIDEWPEEMQPRLFRVFLNRLCRLPDKLIRELRYTVGRWIEKKFLSAFDFDRPLAWATFDHLVSGLFTGGADAMESAMGETRIGGEVVQESRRTFDHAINGPIGHATEGLLQALNSLKLAKGQGIPVEFKDRIEHLLASPGKGGDHAVAILAHNVNWLYSLDPDWVKNWIMPWFNFEDPVSEPAWNGFLSFARIPNPEIGTMLKPFLLDLFPTIYRWSWDRNLTKIATQIVVELAVVLRDEPYGLSPNEARRCLRNMDDRNRQDAVLQLSQIGQRRNGGWSAYVIPFVSTVWPRERTFRTTALVSSWVSLLEETGDDFPAVLASVRKFLIPVIGESYWLYRFGKDVGDEQPLTVKHPGDVLELLDAVVPNSAEHVPPELAQILDLIEETDPRLARDRRFFRLIGLIEQR